MATMWRDLASTPTLIGLVVASLDKALYDNLSLLVRFEQAANSMVRSQSNNRKTREMDNS